ncbi:MAG: sirohydrochlorin cobaltochelatase [Proteobacteria bacterium]|nr:sirohydrochlorin cobaltochelatase [Pseudomonadota bacterium]MBU1060022.1 sirohydrochlorin cobaltochelatase [Pseudomonadota bacterium]
MKRSSLIFLILFLTFVVTHPLAAAERKTAQANGIVLAMFGTTVEPALQSLLNIREAVEKAYPETPVRMAFTSNIIRGIWQERSVDQAYRQLHPQIPEDIFQIQGPLATIAGLQDQGIDSIIVQSTHIAPAEEFLDLCSYVEGLVSIKTIKARHKPFQHLVVGRPALGTFGTTHSYAKDVRQAAKALIADAELARKEEAALVYMGHGNDHFPSGGPYLEFAARMRELYPDVLTLIGTVEGFPGLEDVRSQLQQAGVNRVLLKPFMVVAGDHVMNDMAGPGEGSWLSVLKKEGFEVIPVSKGLGEDPAFVQIYVSHIAETARDAEISLR